MLSKLGLLCILLCIIASTGCSTIHVGKWAERSLVQEEIYYIDTPIDVELNFNAALQEFFSDLGMRTTSSREESTAVVNYSRFCHFDLFQYQCTSINFIIRDSTTGKIFCEYSYKGEHLLFYKAQAKQVSEGIKNECY
jgi:hypothetical protein